MTLTRAQIALGTVAMGALLIGAYCVGYTHEEAAPVDVTVVHEESGELSDLTIDRSGKPMRVGDVYEYWRGAEDSDGLYDHDPAPHAPAGDVARTTES